MTRKLRNALLAGVLLAVPMTSLAATATTAEMDSRATSELAKKVRKELVTLPFYGVFDNFAFSVDDGIVTLTGQVTRPTLKSSAENVVKRIEGVTHVNNQIEVLPLSGFDNDIRFRLLRAIYGYPGLDRYGAGTQPSIRIIVRNGEVTLEGVVDREADSDIAFMRANGVPFVFKVTNNLRIDSRKA